MENEQVYNAYQQRGIRGYGPTGLWSNDYDNPRNIQIGRILIVIVIVLAVIAALVIGIILWRRRLATSSTGSTSGTGSNTGNNTGTINTGGNTGNNNTGTSCATTGCPSGQVCNTSTNTCVQCLGNSNCSGSTPFCNTASYTCKECLATTDCTGTAVCNNGSCCSTTAPTITSVTPTTSDDSLVTIAYNRAQLGVGYTNLQVEVNIETPAGVLLKALSKPITGGTVTVHESELNLPNQHLFPGIGYRTRLRIKYSCGGTDNNTTDYSTPMPFTMPDCPSTALAANQGTTNAAGNPVFNNYPGVAIRFFTNFSPFNIGVLVDQSSTIHPNQAAIYHPLITTTSSNPPIDNTYQFAEIPYPGPIGTTFYFYYFNLGSSCNSVVSGPLQFDRTY